MMKFNKTRASRAVAYVMSAIMISQALLSPTSMVYANAGDDTAAQQEATQVVNGNDSSKQDGASEQKASSNSSATSDSATDSNNATATAEDSATQQGDATTTSTQAANDTANRNAVATQADDGYNGDADPIVIDKSTSADDVTVSVGLYTDAAHKNELGDSAVGANDKIYANVSMTFNKNIKPTKSNPNIEYVFPDSVKVVNSSGSKAEDGKTMFTWSIQDNVFKIRFTKAFFEKYNSEIFAKADFDFTIDASKVGDDNKLNVTFPGTGTTITINQKEGNVNGGKTCELGVDGKTVSYTIDLNPETNVTDFNLEDVLGSNLSYNKDFKLDGQSVSPTIDGNKATIHVDKLSKGSHKLTYTATISQDALDNLKPGASGNAGMNTDAFKNKAKWTWSGKPEGNTSETNPNASFDLVRGKSGAKKDDGTYEWTVDLNTGTLKADMKDYTFTDKLENADALQYTGSYKVIDVTDGNKEVASGKLDSSKGSFDYAFGSDAGKHQYKVVYSTKVKDGAEYGEYKNTASVDDHHGDKDSATGSIDYKPEGTVDVKKEITQELDADGYVSWKTTIGLSKMATGCDITKAWFTDFTGDGWRNADENIWFVGDADLSLTVGGKKLVKGTDYNVYWRNGSSAYDCNATEPAEKNWGFKIVFTDKAQKYVGQSDIVVTYRTKCASKPGTYKNTATFNDGYGHQPSDSKTYEIESKDSTSKEGSLTWDPDFDWSKVDAKDTTKGAWVASWTVKANYAPSEKTNYEQYGLNDTKGDPIYIEDELPAGMAYVPGSGKYTVKANYGNDANGEKCKGEGSLDATVADGKLTANIPTADVYDGKGKGTHYVWAEVTYRTAIKATTEQKDLSFTNKVSSGVGNDSYGSAKSTVTGKQSIIDKKADPDVTNNLVNYSVDVNPQAQDLISDSDVVTLTDTLTGKADLVTDSIKVTDVSGKELGRDEWSYLIEQGSDKDGNPTTTLSIILPDSRALKVNYTASLNGQKGEKGTLTNSARLGGSKKWASGVSTQYTVAGSKVDGGGISSSISIIKEDGSDSSKKLAGAEFNLYKVENISDLASGKPKDIERAGKHVMTKTSDKDGKVVFGGEGDQKLETATLYYFKEIAEPTGYIKNDTITCVVLKGSDDAKYNEVVNQLKAKGVTFSTGSSFPRYNTPTSKAEAEFKARKVLDGRSLKDGEFTFAAFDEKDDKVAEGTNDTDGNVTLKGDGLSWDKEGTYTYTIKEVQGDEAGVAYSQDSYKAVVTVKRDGTYGPLRAKVEYQRADDTKLDANELPTFTNTYKAGDAKVSLGATKSLEGAKLEAGEFEFKLEGDADASGEKVSQTKSNDAEGNVAFGVLKFNKAGEYHYTISEVVPAGAVDGVKDGVTYDRSVYNVTVEVKDNGKGGLEASKTITKDGAKVSEAAFTNSYRKTDSIDVNLSARKRVDGKAPAKGQTFQFELREGTDGKGKVLQTKFNNGDGDIEFDGITYKDTGEHDYTISEKKADGFDCDSKTVKVHVSVTKGDDNQLLASVTYDGVADAPAFENKELISIPVEKKWSGRTADRAEFQLVANDVAVDGKILTLTEENGWKGSFKNLRKVADDGREIKYEVREINIPAGFASTFEVKDGTWIFTNTYTVSGTVNVNLDATKTLKGDGAKLEGGQFQFKLEGDADASGSEVSQTKPNDVEGHVSFDTLTFDKAGTYRYKISEVVPQGAVDGVKAGVTYDRSSFDVTVKVEDNGEGGLKQTTTIEKAGAQVSDIKFANTYQKTEPIDINLSAKKTVDGNTPSEAQKFSFDLNKSDENGTKGDLVQTVQNNGGDVSFKKLTYNKAADEWYLITEQSKDGFKCDFKQVLAHVVVTKGADNQLTRKVTYTVDGKESSEPVIFENTVAPVSTTLKVKKLVNGGSKIASDKDFTFSLYKAGEDGKRTGDELATAAVKPGETADFNKALSFSKAGTYQYVIEETSELGNGWTKADSVIATIEVIAAKDGTLSVKSVAYSKATTDKDAALFDNTYTAKGSATVKVQKTVNGEAPASNQTFDFALTPVDGAPMPNGVESLTAQTVGGDAVSFPELAYSLKDAGKTYTYTIAETTPKTVGWTMAGPVTVTVKVGDDQGDGTLGEATVTYSNATESDKTGAALFNNTYEQASGEFQLGLVKTVNGKVPLKGETFEFSATAEGENAEKAPELKNVTTDADGAAKFQVAKLADKDAGKTYTYRIHEVTDLKGGHGTWTKAADVIATVKVSERSDDNKLTATVSYRQDKDGAESYEGSAKFDNTFKPADVTASVKVKKATVNDKNDFKADETYEFGLYKKGADGQPEGKAIATVSGKLGDELTFSSKELTFSEPGSHEYLIREETHNGSKGWASVADVPVTVTVAAKGGTGSDARDLKATVSYGDSNEAGCASFADTYTAEGSATLKVNKVVNGGKDQAKDESFDFTLKDASGKELSRTSAKAGETAKFSPIDYKLDDAGETFEYTISEIGHDSGRWFKAGDVKATVKVADNNDGTLKTEVTYTNATEENGTGAALFDNTHAAPATAELKVSKTVNGAKEEAAKEKFAFELKADKDGTPMPESADLTVDGTGTGSFGKISYSEPGTYGYTIHETSDLGAGWTNAKDVTATVTVERDESAKTLKVTDIEYSNATEDKAAAAFDNTYTAKGAKASLKASKVLKGADLKAGQFEFQLKDSHGKVLQTAKNDKDGNVSFDPISYELSDLDGRGSSRDFAYTISEVVPADAVDGVKDGITYDTAEHKVTVTVSDDGTSGQLKATVSYDGKSEAPVFTNTYTHKEDKPHGDTPKGGQSGKTSGGMPTTGDTTTMVVSVIATAGLCALASGLRLSRRKRG